MKNRTKYGIILFLILGLFIVFSFIKKENNNLILSHTVDLKKQDLKFYWKNPEGEIFNEFKKLKIFLDKKKETLVFATNGGMFKKGFLPQGLFIENGKEVSKLDTVKNGYGNFYMQPNGIFYITNNNEGVVCETKKFKNKNIKYATQSGPMLLIDGRVHDRFNKNSKNLNIRNGVGILPNGQLVFGMSKQKINFYNFANFFKSLGCENALYLDGFISKTYLPEKNWKSEDGRFGVIIGETITNNRK